MDVLYIHNRGPELEHMSQHLTKTLDMPRIHEALNPNSILALSHRVCAPDIVIVGSGT
jgi:hypothetical protein